MDPASYPTTPNSNLVNLSLSGAHLQESVYIPARMGDILAG